MNPIRPSVPSPSRWVEMAGDMAAITASGTTEAKSREKPEAGERQFAAAAPATPSRPMAMAADGSVLLSRDHRGAVDM
jgi:hypothetical protein